MEHSIICNCGYEAKGKEKRAVEAEIWHHAIKDHSDMLKGMSVEQIEEILTEWDKKFSSKRLV